MAARTGVLQQEQQVMQQPPAQHSTW